jgi:hypothetical protein
MIKITINPADIKLAAAKIESKVKQTELIISPRGLTEVAKAVFTITATKFIRDLALEAKNDPAKFHHIYEWNQVGSPSAKLFLLKRAKINYGELVIALEFIKSKSFVPIRKELLNPGPTGKVVSAQHIFRDKARIMEEGKPVDISSSKIMAFYSESSGNEDGIVFVPAGRTIHINHPGGTKTNHALTSYAEEWYGSRARMVVENSRLIGQIGNAVAKVVSKNKSTPTMVISTIKMISAEYSRELSVL